MKPILRPSLQFPTSSRASDRDAVSHMKHGDSTRCGAPKARGNSYYEWAYVNCPACLATRVPDYHCG